MKLSVMHMKKTITIAILIILITTTFISTNVLPALNTQAELPPKVVKFSLDKTTVYMGYQSIEVKAYIYAPVAPRLTLAMATLISGLTVTVNLTLTELLEAEPITVGGITYNVKYVALGKVAVPDAVYPGIALLKVEVEGVARGITFRNSTTFKITILSSRFIEEERISAYRAFERVSILTFIASALGIDVSKAIEALDQLEAMLKEADSRFIAMGEVDEASTLYKTIILKSDELSSSLLVEMAKVSRDTANSITKLEERLNAVSNSLSNRLDSLTKFSEDLAKMLEGYADSSSRALSTLNDQVNTLNTKFGGVIDYVNDLGVALTQYSAETNKAIETLSKNLNTLVKQQEDTAKNLNTAIEVLSSSIDTLNNKIESLAQSQNSVITTLNNLQLSLIILSVAVLIAITLVILRIKR